MKHKQLINLFQLQCKIQNPINLKMNKKNLKNFTSQSPITQMCQNFMIFIYSSVIFFVVCFFLLPYILSIYKSIKFQSNIFLTEEVHSGNFTHCRQTLNNWLKFIWSKIWKAMEEISLHNWSFFSVFCNLFFPQMIKLNFLISLILQSKTWKPLCFSRIFVAVIVIFMFWNIDDQLALN